VGSATLEIVTTGWTGTIALTYSGVTVTVTPRTRESIASLFARLVHDVYTQAGLALSVTGGQLVVSAASAFDLVVSGTCETRSQFTTGGYTGASRYTAEDTSTGTYVPTLGLRLDGVTSQQDAGRSVSTGASGFAGPLTMGTTRLRMWSSFADTWANEDVSGVYDAWHDGRILGRGRIDSVTRTRMGRLSDRVVMEADFAGCVE